MADKRILCAFGIDLDAVGGWLGSYGGEDSPDDISRGLFAGEVGTLRLLKLFDNLGVQTTWFIPVTTFSLCPLKGFLSRCEWSTWAWQPATIATAILRLGTAPVFAIWI